MPGKTLPFRLYAQILLFSVLVILGVSILWPLQQAMQGGMLSIRDGIITQLETRINRKIHFSAISPSIFGSFDVRNVRIMGSDESPVLTISRFRIAYSLMDLLRGRPQGIHSVWMDSPFIEFNTARDRDLIELFENLNAGDGSFRQNVSALFPEKLVARTRGGKCLIVSDTGVLEFDVPNLNIEISGGRLIFDGRWTVGVVAGNPMRVPVSFHVAMLANGSFSTDMEEGEAMFSIPSITGDAQSASPIAFGLVLKDDAIRLGKMPSQYPLDFSLNYGIDNGIIDARLDCTDFKLGEFLSFSGGLEGASQFQDIAGSGTAFFERRHDGSLGYSINLAGETLSDFPISRFEKASFAIKAEGDEERARIETFRFSMPRAETADALFFGDIGFSGDIGFAPLAPDGTLSLADFSLSGIEHFSADIAIGSKDGGITAFSDTLNLGRVSFNAFSVVVRPSDADLDFSVSASRSMGAGSLLLEGTMYSVSRNVRAGLKLNSVPAGDLAAMTLPFVKNASVPPALVGLLDGASITTEVSFATDFSGVSYNAPRFVVASKVGKGFTGLVSLSGTDRDFELKEGRFNWGDDSLVLSGKAEFFGQKNMHFSINTGYHDLAYLVEGTVLEGKSVNVRGSYGLNVNLTMSGNRGYIGSMSAEGFPVPFLGSPAFLSFTAQLRYDSAASWLVNLEQLELANVSSPAGLAQVRLSGTADQKGVNIPVLYYTDGIGPLNGKVDVFWPVDYSGFTGLAIMEGGAESYRLDGYLTEGHFRFVFAGSSMRLSRVFGSKVNALANGNISLSWDPSGYFQGELDFPSVKGRLYEQEFGASVRAALSREELNITSLNFNLAEFQGAISSIRVNNAQGSAGLQAQLMGIAGGRPVDGAVSIAAQFNPVRSWFEMDEMVRSFDGKLHVEKLTYGTAGEAQTFDINFSRSEGALSVFGGPRDMLRFRMEQGGNFYAGLSSPFPVRGMIIGNITDKTINARCGDLYIDMAGLFNLAPENPDFYMTGGYVNAVLEVRGSLTDPEFFGSARGNSLQIRVPRYIPNELRPIPFSVAIDGNEITFGPVSTTTAKGGAGVVKGWFRIDRWIPNIFSIDIQVPRETPVPYAFDIGGFVAHGDTYGNLNISMENVMFDISGDMIANNSELGINSEEISKSQKTNIFAQAKIPFVVNLTVNTGPVVDFFYPNSRLPIIRANPDLGTKLMVSVDSLSQQYSITSDIKIRSGEIFYFERRFYIRSGTLTFRENENRFEPRLTARAEIRDRTDDGPVTVSMIVDNAPLFSFTARFESTPPLPQMEIFALLGHSITGTQVDENASSLQRALLTSGSELFAQAVIGRQLEQQIRNFTRLDMFSVRTHILQNALYMQTGLMAQPVDTTGRVGNYFDNTSVFGGKYIGQDMFVQGMVSMRYDANKTTTGGITFSPDIGIELQNPLFNIRWDFVPMHPENWYVNDNAITVTKTWSF